MSEQEPRYSIDMIVDGAIKRMLEEFIIPNIGDLDPTHPGGLGKHFQQVWRNGEVGRVVDSMIDMGKQHCRQLWEDAGINEAQFDSVARGIIEQELTKVLGEPSSD